MLVKVMAYMYKAVGIALAVFTADFFLKGWLMRNYAYQSIPVIAQVFHITVVFNTGAAFSMLQGKTMALAWVGIFFLIFFWMFVKSEKQKNALFCVACGMIMGGALSNLVDRFTLGYVVDYLDFRVWPVFNISDSCITVGTIFLLWDSWNKRSRQASA